MKTPIVSKFIACIGNNIEKDISKLTKAISSLSEDEALQVCNALRLRPTRNSPWDVFTEDVFKHYDSFYKEPRVIPLGSFELKSKSLRVTDPCYSKDTWCSGVLLDVKPGTYNAFVLRQAEDSWGVRNAQLYVCHEDHPGVRCHTRAAFEVGVDSGQAGFFDEKYYPKGETGDYDEKESFYGAARDATLTTQVQAGVLPHGAVSSSGFGDGGYACRYATNENGQIIAANITFIDDPDEKED